VWSTGPGVEPARGTSNADARRIIDREFSRRSLDRCAGCQKTLDPDALEITARLLINIDPPSSQSELAVRRHVTAYLNVPVYRAFQEWLGRGDALGPMWSAWQSGDRRAAVAAVPEQVMNDLIIRGSMETIGAHVQRYLDAGVDTAFLALSTLEQNPARRRAIQLDALRALAPATRVSA